MPDAANFIFSLSLAFDSTLLKLILEHAKLFEKAARLALHIAAIVWKHICTIETFSMIKALIRNDTQANALQLVREIVFEDTN